MAYKKISTTCCCDRGQLPPRRRPSPKEVPTYTRTFSFWWYIPRAISLPLFNLQPSNNNTRGIGWSKSDSSFLRIIPFSLLHLHSFNTAYVVG